MNSWQHLGRNNDRCCKESSFKEFTENCYMKVAAGAARSSRTLSASPNDGKQGVSQGCKLSGVPDNKKVIWKLQSRSFKPVGPRYTVWTACFVLSLAESCPCLAMTRSQAKKFLAFLEIVQVPTVLSCISSQQYWSYLLCSLSLSLC